MMGLEKALTFRASSIGDCLMGKYLLENIHAAYPLARCGIVVASCAEMIRDLFGAYPWLEIIEARRRHPRALLSLWNAFHGSEFVVTQYAGKPGGKFGLASKIAARFLAKKGGLIGFTDVSCLNRVLYDVLLPQTPLDAPAALERAALRAARIPVTHAYPTMQHVPLPHALGKFGLTPGTYLVVHLFAGNASRGLHPDKKRALLSALIEHLPSVHMVVSGGADDVREAEHIAENIPATIIAGKTTLQELMNIIAGGCGVVSVDTGVAHIAAQLGTPLVVIRTCLGRHWWLPEQYGKDAPITVFSRDELCGTKHTNKDFPICINEINVEDVASHIAAVLRHG